MKIPGISLYDRLFLSIQKKLGYPTEKNRFRKKTGYKLSLSKPRSFNEKIVWRKLFDRNPLFPIVSDKYKVRKYVEEKLGQEEAKRILIPLLYETTEPAQIPFDTLPEEFIIKANHASNRNLIVEKNCTLTNQEIINKCSSWLTKAFNVKKFEWAYSAVKPRRIVIEKLYKDEFGNLPIDYKIFVFSGDVVMIEVDHARFSQHTRTLYNAYWEPLDVSLKFSKGPIIEKPSNFAEMKRIAKSLAEPFDFMRVDLFNIGGKVFFGELTVYHGSGYERFAPQSFDFELGSKWKLSSKK